MKKYLIVVLALAIILFLAVSAEAVHDASLTCSECHSMHSSVDGADQSNGYFLLKNGGTTLVRGSNDACLSCHDGTVTDAPDVDTIAGETPGGDFADADWTGPGFNQAHDIDATGMLASGTATENAPTGDGSTNSIGDFRCASCHDPHKQAGSRLLRTGTEIGTTGTMGATGSAAVPTVQWATLTETSVETAALHNQYNSGMSAWCANCHTDLVDGDPDSDYHHPAGGTALAQLPSAYQTAYGADYTHVYPFEDPEFAAPNLTTDWGPIGTSNNGTDEFVMCLTCHRAHATANDYIGRFDLTGSQGSGTGCNKCHNK